jgi:hypothetical protein
MYLMDDQFLTLREASATRDQRKALELKYSDEKTYLILIASNSDSSRNAIHKISCKQGIPLEGYVYDAKSDSYFYDCYDYLQIGYIPVSIDLLVKGSSWTTKVPLTDEVILKFLNESQFRDADHFKSLFSPDEYLLEFIQLIDSK